MTHNISHLPLLARCLAAGAALVALPAAAVSETSGSLKQSVSGYRDTAGQERSKLALESSIKAGASNFSLGLTRERVIDQSWQENKYLKEIYGQGLRINDGASLAAGHTFARLTDVRVAAAYNSDGVIATRVGGAGVSRWLVHETLQASLDVTHTAVARPEYEILDYDATVLTAPPRTDTTGWSIGMRHLSTPTTVTLANVTVASSSDRPLARFYQLGVRQYVPAFSGALHGSVYRGLNRGGLSTSTLYGEVDSWTGDIAWVQEAGPITQVRVGWRVYQEKEVGRAYGDVTQFGSDLLSASLVHEIPAKSSPLPGHPVSVETGVARYMNNQGLRATIANFGIGGKF